MRLSISTVGNIVGIQAQEIAKVAEKYAAMGTSEIEVNIFKNKYILKIYSMLNLFLHDITETYNMNFFINPGWCNGFIARSDCIAKTKGDIAI